MTPLLLLCLAFAVPPAILFAANLRAYRPAPPPGESTPAISVLIPARNEERSIGEAVESVLRNAGAEVEVLVLDDRSDDGTADVVRSIAGRDGRVRLISGDGPPPGWCGKQRACWLLAQEARHDLFVFLDADVRLEPDALTRIARFLDDSGVDLASGVPRQVTGGLMERLLIPLIHFVMLGFLSIRRMRRTSLPSLSAGCGQLFAARREGYFQAGGHAAIRSSLHDGIKLPRAFRAAGLRNDLFDATDVARCRMYRTAGEVWQGLAKNAGEGLASPGLIVPISLVLLGGQVLPFVLAIAAVRAWPRPWTGLEASLLILSLGAAWAPRLAAAFRFRQSLVGAMLHPIGITLLVAIQWYAFVRKALGKPSRWKGRGYADAAPDPSAGG